MRSLLLLGALAIAVQAPAQCRPPANTHEARLLAFYEAPLVFSAVSAPVTLPAGALSLTVEGGNIPSPSAEIQRPEYCYQPHSEHTTLTRAYGRPRVTLGLPKGLTLEASYLPPVPVGGATPNLASLALSRVMSFQAGALPVTAALRVQGTLGSVRGSITCPGSALQTADPAAPCFGTHPSRDTFYPDMFGAEGVLAMRDSRGRVAEFVGAGIGWIRPRFRVGFTDGAGVTDATEVEASLLRGSAFGGVTVRVTDALRLSGQVYSVPKDATTLRVAAEYRRW